jgi:hypothetical protein
MLQLLNSCNSCNSSIDVVTADMERLLEEVSKLLIAYASAIESNR